jgi:hypothetical protein
MVDEALDLTVFVVAFRAAFGARAVEVAVSQRDLASGTVREQWLQIVEALALRAP